MKAGLPQPLQLDTLTVRADAAADYAIEELCLPRELFGRSAVQLKNNEATIQDFAGKGALTKHRHIPETLFDRLVLDDVEYSPKL